LATKFTEHILQEYPDIQLVIEEVEDYFMQCLIGLSKLLVKQLPRNVNETADEAMEHYFESHLQGLAKKHVAKWKDDVSVLLFHFEWMINTFSVA